MPITTESLEELITSHHGELFQNSNGKYVKVSQVGVPQIVCLKAKDALKPNNLKRACESGPIVQFVQKKWDVRPDAYVRGVFKAHPETHSRFLSFLNYLNKFTSSRLLDAFIHRNRPQNGYGSIPVQYYHIERVLEKDQAV